MEVDDFVSVARDCAKQLHGDKATLSVEEMPTSYPAAHRFRASVKLRGVTVEAKHAETHSASVRELARDLASRSRQALHTHQSVEFRASILGL